MTEEEAAKENRDWLIEMNSKMYDKAAAYMNVILIAGYASAFTIWNFTKGQMGQITMTLIALFLTASLTVFVFFEVYKMTVNAVYFHRFQKILRTAKRPTEFLSAYQNFLIDSQKLTGATMSIWVVCLSFCVGTAVISLLMLFYTFLSVVLPPLS